MKKLFTSLACMLSIASLYAQPVLMSDSLHTGHVFNLYSLAAVNVANIAPTGAGINWDISAATATLAGTSEFQDMASTPHAAQYPLANFAIKFTMGASPFYSLFILSPTKLEEVAYNVGGAAPVNFIDYRNTLVFPFGYGLSDTDTYQKTAQATKTIINTYTGYGNLMTNPTTYANAVQFTIDDDGSTKGFWWNSSPLVPLFQADAGFVLWKPTAAPNGLIEYSTNAAFDLYPNPATNSLHIVNKQLISRMDIFNAAGQFQFSTTNSVIDITTLKTGIYYLKASTKNGVVAQQFIKQ